jgi:hypothetical protein
VVEAAQRQAANRDQARQAGRRRSCRGRIRSLAQAATVEGAKLCRDAAGDAARRERLKATPRDVEF